MSERRNLPSASGLERYALCPGSFLMELEAPQSESTPEAESGTRIHAVLAGTHNADTLTDEERDIADRCQSQRDVLVAKLSEDHGPTESIHVERRLWYGDKRWSGQADYVRRFDDGHVLIVDYKTGRAEVEHAAGNMQLRALLTLEESKKAVITATVAIVQPMAGPPSVCYYEREDINRAYYEVTELMERVKMPGQQRIPSAEACKYCRAKAVCPEAREAALVPPLSNIPAGTTPEAIAATCTNDTLARFLERAQFATKVIEACKDEAKARIERGDQIPGWTLKPGAVRESITQPETVFARFANAGGTTEQFMGAVSIAKGKLKDAVKAATGDKGKALDARMDAILAGCTEAKPTAPSLARVKGEA